MTDLSYLERTSGLRNFLAQSDPAIAASVPLPVPSLQTAPPPAPMQNIPAPNYSAMGTAGPMSVAPPQMPPAPPIDAQPIADKSPMGKFLDIATEAYSPGHVAQNEHAAAAPQQFSGDSFGGRLAAAFIPGVRGMQERERGQALAQYAATIPGGDAISHIMALDPVHASAYVGPLMALAAEQNDPMKKLQLQEMQRKADSGGKISQYFQGMEGDAQPAPPSGSAPIGVQANNPLNIRVNPANNWQGQTGALKGFAQFDTPEHGFRAGAKILDSYAKDGVNTLDDVVKRWAPASDGNDPESYADQVSQASGIPRGANINPADPYVQQKLLAAMQQVEIGKGNALPQDVVNSGVSQARGGALSDFASMTPQEKVAVHMASIDPAYAPMALAAMAKVDKTESTPYTAQGKATADYNHGLITKAQLDAQTSTGGLEDSGLTGQPALEYLRQTNKGLASDVEMALRGDYPMTSMSSRNQHTLDVMRAANMIDPTFTPTTYQARVATAKDYAPSGKSGTTLIAVNTAASHLAELKKAYEELDNGGFNTWNAIANKTLGQFDTKTHAAMNRFNTALNAVAPELAKIYSGTGTVAEGEIKHRREALNPNDGPEAMRASLNEAAALIKGKSDSLIDAYQKNMGGKKPPTFQPFSDEALAQFNDLGVDITSTNAKVAGDTGAAATGPALSDLQAAAAAELAKRGH